jgi:hypothetical protein
MDRLAADNEGMELRLTAHGIELSDELRRFIERRARFGVGRLAARVRSMAIRLKDVNGPRGGVDQMCDVEVDLGLAKPVIIRERRANVFSAVAFAMDRAGRAARRRLGTLRNRRPDRTGAGQAPDRDARAMDAHDRRERLFAAVELAFARE